MGQGIEAGRSRIRKEPEETLVVDGCVHCLIIVLNFMGIDVHQNVSEWTFYVPFIISQIHLIQAV